VAACRCQVITIDEHRVRVEKGSLRREGARKGGPETRHDFNRAWTRLDVEEQEQPGKGLRLWVGASGKRVEVGEFLTDWEKRQLANELRRRIVGAEVHRQGEKQE
jgi:uncharacterized membrane protein